MAKKKKAGGGSIASGYLHGFSKEEQDRLYRQARFFESTVFEGVEFHPHDHVLEVGCGVGAQTEILLERYPGIHVFGIDASKDQLKRAKHHLAKPMKAGRVEFHEADALHLSYAESTFDGAFICWFLEHIKQPIEVLKEVRRTLRPSGRIYCSEVLNASFYVHPYSPATLQYWFAFNDHQWNLGGDPFVGAKLANYLTEAGFQDVETQVEVFHLDNRTPKRRSQFIAEWTSQLLSGAQELIEAKKVTPQVVEEMKQELDRLKDDPDSVFFNATVKARAIAL